MRIAFGAATAYVSFFLFHGLYLPYFPLWLKYRQMSEDQIAILLAVPMLLRVVISSQMISLADRYPDRANVLSVFYFAATAAFCLYEIVQGFWWLLAITLMFNLFWNPILPIMDAMTLSAVRRFSIDYGKVRIWGSIAFIIANLAGGVFLGALSAEYILIVTMIILILGSFASLSIPRVGRANPPSGQSGFVGDHTVRAMLRKPEFLLIMIAAGLIQSSHALLYGFGSIYWESLGLGGGTIGALWALGVVVEIVIFQLSSRFLLHVSTIYLMILAGAAGIIRWSVMMLDLHAPGFFLLQILHGVTFGATHIATMHFLKDSVPENKISSAQGAAFLLGGVIMAASVMASGPIYHHLGRYGFGLMAVMCMIALVCLQIGEKLQPKAK